MATFMDRFKLAIGERGYEPAMRRSIQTVVLYEAHRCIASRMPSMRPFQRKVAFFDQAKAILEATGFMPHQQEEIMWRTGTSKEAMNAETGWKRLKLIEKEINSLRARIRPFCEEGKSHDDVVNQYIQQQFEAVSGNKGKPFPPGWEHSHNNVIMAYRMYFDGHEHDPTFPPAIPIKEVVVPAAKIAAGQDDSNNFLVQVPQETGDMAAGMGTMGGSLVHGTSVGQKSFGGYPPVTESAVDRMEILKEIRLHMDLLNDFVGTIPQQYLNKRKRELFQAMPSTPPSTSQRTNSKRARTEPLDTDSVTGDVTM